jgi:hypothetical protein
MTTTEYVILKERDDLPVYHVYPLGESDMHKLFGSECPCGTRVMSDEDCTVMVHRRLVQ